MHQDVAVGLSGAGVVRPERSSRGWSTRHLLACGCERVRGRPAYLCPGLAPRLGRRGASGAGFSARQARRRKLGTEPTDRPTSSERGNHHSPLRDPAAAASRTAATAHDRAAHPTRADCASWRTSHPRKSSPAISSSIVLRPQGPLELGGPAPLLGVRRAILAGRRSAPTSITSSRQRRSGVPEMSGSRRISAIDRSPRKNANASSACRRPRVRRA
jgi:hypothetical protein